MARYNRAAQAEYQNRLRVAALEPAPPRLPKFQIGQEVKDGCFTGHISKINWNSLYPYFEGGNYDYELKEYPNIRIAEKFLQAGNE